MIAEQSYGAHSALVKMRLIVNDTTIRITHMGPDFLLIESAAMHPPGNAMIILQVDQNVRSWAVWLPDGISAESKRVAIAAAA